MPCRSPRPAGLEVPMVDDPSWPPQKPLRTRGQRPPGRGAFCRVCGPVDLTLLEEDAVSTARHVFFGLRHVDRPASLRYLTPLRVGVPFSDETFAGPIWGHLVLAATKPPLGLVASSGPPNTGLHLQGAPQRLLAKRAHLRALSGARPCSTARHSHASPHPHPSGRPVHGIAAENDRLAARVG